MGRPRQHDESTATALLDAAERLLATGGPDAVGVRSVARDAGASTRAVYSLFESKAGLLQALAARGYQSLAERVTALPETDDPTADLVTAGVEGFRTFALTRPGLFRVAFERIPTEVTSSVANEASAASYAALARLIRRAQDAGAMHGVPEEEAAFAFHACCQGLGTSELSREPPPVGSGFWQRVHGIDGEQLWRRTLKALVAGLSPAQTSQDIGS